jgi:hypothetical protein
MLSEMLSVRRIGPRGLINMKRILLALLLAGFLKAPAFAQTKVGDWDIEKRAHDEHCNASRAHKDTDADQNVIVLTYSKDAIVIVLIYEGWEWGKDDKIVKADFGTDQVTIMKKTKWEVMDKTTVEFSSSISRSSIR